MPYKIKNDSGTFYYNKNSMLHRKDGPAIEYSNGGKQWWVNGKRHREDGPAIIDNFCKQWYINGELHREDGPAIEYNNGSKFYFLNNHQYSEREFFAMKRFGDFV